MSTFRDVLIDTLHRSRECFAEALAVATPEQANTPPTPVQAPLVFSLTWLAWHTAREIDCQLSPLAGLKPLWTSAGFKERFALPLPDDTEDWRHSAEEAALVRVDDLEVLSDYLNAAYARAEEYLQELPDDALDDIVDDRWDPPVTRGIRLASIIDDAAQHSGQAYYSGMLEGLPG